MGFAVVDADYVSSHLDNGFILDVRPEFMYIDAHIPGAKTLDFWFLKTESGFLLPTRMVKFLDEMGALRDEPLIVYDNSGGMARETCDILADQGFTQVCYYAEGWSDWASDPSRPRALR